MSTHWSEVARPCIREAPRRQQHREASHHPRPVSHPQRVDADMVDSFGASPRVVGRSDIGLDTVYLVAARERDIGVINEADYPTEEVARADLGRTTAHGRLVGKAIAPTEEST